MRADDFFAYARTRHDIYHRRTAGQPAPWTDDPVLHKYRFTNVYRELDAVSVWFRENVRDPLRSKPEVLLATVLFRWFNRITTGEAIFSQTSSMSGEGALTTWDLWMRKRDTDQFMDTMQQAVASYCRRGPYVTGAYIIKTPNGMDKLSGVLDCVEKFMTLERPIDSGRDLVSVGWEQAATSWLEHPGECSLEQAWEWLRQFPYMGDFMAYEVITDLRHTALLDRAPDIMTWANPGPGAMRGLNRILGRPLNHSQPKHVFVCEMRRLLDVSLEKWPNNETYPALEMRDIEHTLCEFDKYERARLGEGRPRGVYPHGK